MPNLTPADIARGLHWCDTIETDPVAKDLLASLVVLNARELLELAARGMQGDWESWAKELMEQEKIPYTGNRGFDISVWITGLQNERDDLMELLKSIGETYPQRMMMAPLVAKARELTR